MTHARGSGTILINKIKITCIIRRAAPPFRRHRPAGVCYMVYDIRVATAKTPTQNARISGGKHLPYYGRLADRTTSTSPNSLIALTGYVHQTFFMYMNYYENVLETKHFISKFRLCCSFFFVLSIKNMVTTLL